MIVWKWSDSKKHGYKAEADFLKVVRNWRWAIDERGLMEQQRWQFCDNFLDFILDDWGQKPVTSRYWKLTGMLWVHIFNDLYILCCVFCLCLVVFLYSGVYQGSEGWLENVWLQSQLTLKPGTFNNNSTAHMEFSQRTPYQVQPMT